MKKQIEYLNQLIQSKAPKKGQIPFNIIKTLSPFWLSYLIELFEKSKKGESIVLDINPLDDKVDYMYLTNTLILTGEKCYIFNITK